MKIGDVEIKNFMTLNYEFSGIRILDETLLPNAWSLKINLVALDTIAATNADNIQTRGEYSYHRLYYWLDSCLANVVAVNVENEVSFNVANIVNNVMMYCPGEPTDDLIVRLIHSKLTALSAGTLYIGDIYIESTDCNASYTFMPIDGSYEIPNKVSDYIKLESLHEDPWWLRDDGFCFEFLKPDSEDFDDIEIVDLYENVEDPLNEFEETYMGHGEPIEEKPAEIIHVDKWKPKTV